MQARLEKPLIVFDAVALEVGLHLGQVVLKAELRHHLVALGLGLIKPALAVLFAEQSCKLFDIVAVVAVLGELNCVLALYKLKAASLDGGCKLLDLIAGIVYIELTPNIVARSLQNGSQRIAQHAAAGVAHMHWACGVCGNELDHELLTLADIAAAVALALIVYKAHDIAVPLVAHAEVHKARACDLARCKPASVKLHVRNKRLGDLSRRHAHELCACHRKVCGVIAVCGVLGYLDAAVEGNALGQLALCGGGKICIIYELRYLLLGHLNHVCHFISVPLH